MTTLAAIITRTDFEVALAASSAVGTQTLTGLAAPLDADWLGRIAEAWDKVELALRKAYAFGRDAVQDALHRAVQEAEDLIQSAGHKAREVHQALLERAQAYLSVILDSALQRIRPMVEIGGIRMELESVDLEERIALSGALKAAITELVELTASGEVSVAAHYGRTTSTG